MASEPSEDATLRARGFPEPPAGHGWAESLCTLGERIGPGPRFGAPTLLHSGPHCKGIGRWCLRGLMQQVIVLQAPRPTALESSQPCFDCRGAPLDTNNSTFDLFYDPKTESIKLALLTLSFAISAAVRL